VNLGTGLSMVNKMKSNKKIIFISTFVITLAVIIVVYIALSPSNTSSNTKTTVGSIYQSFNPFGSNTNTGTGTNQAADNNPGNATPETPNTQDQEKAPSKFHKITDFAVSGASFLEDTRPASQTTTQSDTQIQSVTPTDGEKTAQTITTPVKQVAKKTKKVTKITPPAPKFEKVDAIRYVERATGHIYEMYLDNKVIGKISNSTIPTIYEAILGNNSSSVVYRYLDSDNQTINTFTATLGGTKGEFLQANITDITTSPDKTKFFYLVNNTNGVTGIIKSFTDTKRSQVFTSPFTEWLSQWVGDKTIYLTTKASSRFNGSMFSLNITNGVLTKVFGNIPGLTTLSNHKGSMVIYSTALSSGPKLGLFDIGKHTGNYLSDYGLPEKCVWGDDDVYIYCAIPNNISGSDYPDLWYQGLVSFDDHFVKINSSTGLSSFIADSSEGETVDATELFLDKNENTLFFINKKDYTLWSIDLK
jgi:hypothetical protein